MSAEKVYSGSCFCGNVKFELTGEPEAMAYCHCNSCRRWSAGPVSAFTLWKPESINILNGESDIGVFTKNPGSEDDTIYSIRKWCKKCGGHVLTDHPIMRLVDVPAVLIEGFQFNPGFHVHYQDSVHHMLDGLPKWRDLPKEAGGSGEQMSE